MHAELSFPAADHAEMLHNNWPAASADGVNAPVDYPPDDAVPRPRGRRRNRRRRRGNDTRALPSVTEVALYVLLSAGTAGAVLIAAGHPLADVAVVAGAAVALVTVLALTSRRAGRPVRQDPPPAEPSSADVDDIAE